MKWRRVAGLGTAGVLAAGMVGCGGGTSTSGSSSSTGTTTTTPPVAPGATAVYVIQNPASGASNAGQILQFATTASGSISPVTGLQAAANTSFSSITADTANNLYVATTTTAGGGDVREYTSGSIGSAIVLRSLPADSTTMIGAVNGIAADNSGNIFVAEDSGGIAAFGPSQTGDMAPSRYILGSSQTGGGLSTVVVANAVAVDAADNIYVVALGSPNGAPIVIFGPTATGNVAPIRTIGGALTGLTVGSIGGITTDASGNLWVTTNTSSGSSTAGTVLEFAAGATGNVAPIKTISGPQTQLAGAYGIRVDTIGSVFVASYVSATHTPTVLSFSVSASGNSTPQFSFTSPTWTNPDAALSIGVH